jgi:hypothetical protein
VGSSAFIELSRTGGTVFCIAVVLSSDAQLV